MLWTLANHKLVLIPDQSCNYFNHQFHLFHYQAGTYISLQIFSMYVFSISIFIMLDKHFSHLL